MTGVTISIDRLSPEIMAAYRDAADLDRGGGGPDALHWAFEANPNPFAIARKDGRIVGISAYMRSRMKFGSTEGVAVQAVDSFVDSDMRGQSIFTRLGKAYDDYAARTGIDLVWGFPNDNAAPAWFRKLGWKSHGQVPFLFKPLRAGYFLRKLRLSGDFPTCFAKDQNVAPITSIGDWADRLWECCATQIGCGTRRDRSFLTHRLLNGPQAADYRIVADEDSQFPALVVTREAMKHGGRIAYLMEAMGGDPLKELLLSELGRLRNRGVEIVLAWCFPWSPNYAALRAAGFLPLPELVRPIRIWFGSRPHTPAGASANDPGQWYLSYLDSDTV